MNYQNTQDLYNYVDEDAISKDLICSICLRPFVIPMEHTECGNEFCISCIAQLDKCPLCKAQFKFTLRQSTAKRLLNPLNELKVICTKCDALTQRGEIMKHICLGKFVCFDLIY